jgi:hypothetical protein
MPSGSAKIVRVFEGSFSPSRCRVQTAPGIVETEIGEEIPGGKVKPREDIFSEEEGGV